MHSCLLYSLYVYRFDIGFLEAPAASDAFKEFAMLLSVKYKKEIHCGRCSGSKWNKTSSVCLPWRSVYGLKIGQHFDLLIRCEANEFQVYVRRSYVLVHVLYVAETLTCTLYM